MNSAAVSAVQSRVGAAGEIVSCSNDVSRTRVTCYRLPLSNYSCPTPCSYYRHNWSPFFEWFLSQPFNGSSSLRFGFPVRWPYYSMANSFWHNLAHPQPTAPPGHRPACKIFRSGAPLIMASSSIGHHGILRLQLCAQLAISARNISVAYHFMGGSPSFWSCPFINWFLP